MPSSRLGGQSSGARHSSNTWSSCASRCGCASENRPRSRPSSRGSPEASMRRISGATTVVALAGVLGGAAIARGQHGHTGSHDEGHRVAQACATEFEQVVGEGRGFGMAFAADQHGYPGPMHVLELKDRLKLTAEQEEQMQHLKVNCFSNKAVNKKTVIFFRLIEPKLVHIVPASEEFFLRPNHQLCQHLAGAAVDASKAGETPLVED